MFQSPFPEKVVITTATKIKLIQSLSEFWSLKSLFIQAKTNPNLLGSSSFQDKALEYFEKSSNIAKQKFWASLSLEARKKAAKYFVLQEVTETTNTRMSTERDSAAVYIILNGSATLKSSDSAQERVYNTGDIFGAVDVFDRVCEGDEEGENEDQFDSERIRRPKFMTATMKKGTYLRISLADFYQHIMSVDKVLPGIDEDEYAKIAEIPWAELTDEDKRFIEIYKHTRTVVRKDMFDYLSCFKLIPNNARVPSVKYYKEGNVGHHIALHVNDPVCVFFLLSGAMRVEIESHRNHNNPGANTHVLSCKRKGKREMVVKTYSLPLLLLEGGGMLCLGLDCFHVGEKPVGQESDGAAISRGSIAEYESKHYHSLHHHHNHHQHHEHQHHEHQHHEHQHHEHQHHDHQHHEHQHHEHQHHEHHHAADDPHRSPSPPGRKLGEPPSSTPSVASTPLNSSRLHVHASRKGQKKLKGDTSMYDIRLVFEKYTTYLQIPLLTILKHLEDKIVIRSLANSIRSQLQRSSDMVLNRLTNLEPWIRGNMAFQGPPILSSLGDYSAAPLADNLLSSKLDGKHEKLDNGSANHLGSFTYSRLDQNTSSSASLLTTDPSVASSRPPPQSRMRSIIANLKKQTKILRKIDAKRKKRELLAASFMTEPLTAIEENAGANLEHGAVDGEEASAPMLKPKSNARSKRVFSLGKIEENAIS